MSNVLISANADSPWHNDDLDEADKEENQGGTGHIRTESGVHLLRVLHKRSKY